MRLITRNGNDFTRRFPLAAAAVSARPARSCLLDGEAIVCDESGLAVFDLIRRSRHGAPVALSIWIETKNPAAPAVKREAEEEWRA